jgi:hypothetical protein
MRNVSAQESGRMHPYLMPFGFLALGLLFVGLAGLLLAEYRRAFFADPRSIMSFEVLAQILRLGGPGYAAVVVFVAGVLLLMAGVALLVIIAWISMQPVAQAVLRTLGGN